MSIEIHEALASEHCALSVDIGMISDVRCPEPAAFTIVYGPGSRLPFCRSHFALIVGDGALALAGQVFRGGVLRVPSDDKRGT